MSLLSGFEASLGGSRFATISGSVVLTRESTRTDQVLGEVIRFRAVQQAIVRDAKTGEDLCYFSFDAEIWRDDSNLYTLLSKIVSVPGDLASRRITSVYAAVSGSQKFCPVSYIELRSASGGKTGKLTPPAGGVLTYHHKKRLTFSPIRYSDSPQRFVYSLKQKFGRDESIDIVFPIVHYDYPKKFRIGVNMNG